MLGYILHRNLNIVLLVSKHQFCIVLILLNDLEDILMSFLFFILHKLHKARIVRIRVKAELLFIISKASNSSKFRSTTEIESLNLEKIFYA